MESNESRQQRIWTTTNLEYNESKIRRISLAWLVVVLYSKRRAAASRCGRVGASFWWGRGWTAIGAKGAKDAKGRGWGDGWWWTMGEGVGLDRDRRERRRKLTLGGSVLGAVKSRRFEKNGQVFRMQRGTRCRGWAAYSSCLRRGLGIGLDRLATTEGSYSKFIIANQLSSLQDTLRVYCSALHFSDNCGILVLSAKENRASRPLPGPRQIPAR